MTDTTWKWASPPRGTDGVGRWYWRMPGRPEVDVMHITGPATPWCELHETFTICNVVAGPPITWRCRAGAYTRAVNRVMLVNPGDLHWDVANGGSGAFQVLRVPRAVAEAVDESRAPTSGPLVLAHETQDAEVIAAIARFHTGVLALGGGPVVESLLTSLLQRLLASCRARSADLDLRGCEHVSLRRAREHMRANMASELTLDELAAVARIGKFRLIHLFREHLGCPPHQYMVHMRVARARCLLAQGIACGKVARDVGFSDQSHLNRWFTRLWGVTPGAYQRQGLRRGSRASVAGGVRAHP